MKIAIKVSGIPSANKYFTAETFEKFYIVFVINILKKSYDFTTDGILKLTFMYYMKCILIECFVKFDLDADEMFVCVTVLVAAETALLVF